MALKLSTAGKWAIAGLVLAVLLGVVWLKRPPAAATAPVAAESAGVESAGAASSRPALTVRTTTLQTEQWARTITANGSIQPWQEAVIGAQLPGLRITEVKVGIGDWVKQGDVLVTLGYPARANGESSGFSEQGRVVAPDDGVISVANANVGSMVQPSAELFRLIRKGRLEWRAELTAEELMLLRNGMSAEVTVGEGRVVKGTVRAISPSVDPRTRYGYALVSLASSNGIIAGAFARGSFDVGSSRSTLQTLPESAVMQRGKLNYVLTIADGNRVHEQEVELGQRSGDRVQIRQGLTPNEPVVESGGAFLTEGDVVRVLENAGGSTKTASGGKEKGAL